MGQSPVSIFRCAKCRPLGRRRASLLRGSALIVALLVFWWFVLLNPLLLLLRMSSGMIWGIFVDNSGKFISETAPTNWSLHFPVQFTVPPSPQRPAPLEIHSVDFDVARTEVTAFTFSLPVYWAIVLAVTDVRRNLRPLALGTMLVAVLEALLFWRLLKSPRTTSQLSGRTRKLIFPIGSCASDITWW